MGWLNCAFAVEIGTAEIQARALKLHWRRSRYWPSLITPAMQLGVTDHIWSIGELVDMALSDDAPTPAGRKVGSFRIIEGGRE
jgi:hypothetical protein